MTRIDPLAVVEAGYEYLPDERAWLDGIVRAARAWDCGQGIAAYSIDLRARAPSIEAFVQSGAAPELETAVKSITAAAELRMARRIYAPTEFVGNAAHRLRRLANRSGKPHTVNAWALIAGDPRERSVALMFPGDPERFDPEQRFPHRAGRLLGLAGAHLGAALRLRQLAAPLSNGDAATEAVLDPRGRVLHAVGEVRDRDVRETIGEAVVRRERARGRLRRAAPEEAAELWSVLVSGRWSIVDVVERDGKRLVLARKNPVASPDVLSLTAEERDVVWLSTLGHTYKYIAYELGLSVAGVHRRLASALRKLRLKSRADLRRRDRLGPARQSSNVAVRSSRPVHRRARRGFRADRRRGRARRSARERSRSR